MEHTLIKIGGELAGQPEALEKICREIIKRQQQNQKVLLVHGGGPQINSWSERLGVPVKQYHGRRVTDEDTLEVMQAVVAGVVNPNVVAGLRKAGIRSAGLTGIDAGITTATKRPPLTYGEESIDYGLIGEITDVDVSYLRVFTENTIVPVIGCLTWSEAEGILNINADTLARKLAAALPDCELILLSSIPGVYDAEQNIIPRLNRKQEQHGLDAGWITTGMQPTHENGFGALEEGVDAVTITNPDGLVGDGGTRLFL